MIENHLTKALREKITEVVKDFRLPVKNGEPRPPTVINGYLPPKRTGAEDDFPFIIVRAESGKSEEETTTIDVAIVIGCYSKEYDAHEDCINVMTRIRLALASMENGVLDNRFVLQFPIEWNLMPEQPYPQWQLDIQTHWVYNTPQATFKTEEL